MLEQYWQKRKFNETPEPKGNIKRDSHQRFVVGEHNASHLHWDFRLEDEGVLKSWAVPKGIPEEAGVKHLAVQTEDHPIDYIDFQGVIPKGQYGAGKVKIWDKGTYTFKRNDDKIKEFELNGKRLNGFYVMVKTKFKDQDDSWLLWKKDSKE